MIPPIHVRQSGLDNKHLMTVIYLNGFLYIYNLISYRRNMSFLFRPQTFSISHSLILEWSIRTGNTSFLLKVYLPLHVNLKQTILEVFRRSFRPENEISKVCKLVWFTRAIANKNKWYSQRESEQINTVFLIRIGASISTPMS